mmetsp:Transcript_2738/g.7660  ORF Transcript_2738/g.7660 Transcript_2738/m.7660 type:complete len:449 (+) Transcript_2738:1-1347(+)
MSSSLNDSDNHREPHYHEESSEEAEKSYRRWFDGNKCGLKSCNSELRPDHACVVLVTNESKRRQQAKSKKPPAIDWVKNGRLAIHRECFDQVNDNENGKLSSRAEKNLFRASLPTAEFFDDASTVQQKAAETAKLFWFVSGKSKKPSPCVVAFTGAGISSSAGIPTYRGSDGIDTKEAMKHATNEKDNEEEEEEGAPYSNLKPTATHRILAKLEKQGWLSYIASQNCDNLHGKAGTSRDKLTELHGNIFIEYCSDCHKEYERPYEVDAYSTDCYKENYYVKCGHCGFGHFTGRRCSVHGCQGKLKDTIVNFGDPLHNQVLGGLSKATGNFLAADICLAMGSSLSVSPANMLVTLPHFLVVVNLQSTDQDNDAHVRVWGESDQFMECLSREMRNGPSTETPEAVVVKGKHKRDWEELKAEIEYSKEQETIQEAVAKNISRQSKRKKRRG